MECGEEPGGLSGPQALDLAQGCLQRPQISDFTRLKMTVAKGGFLDVGEVMITRGQAEGKACRRFGMGRPKRHMW
jgi:hypothetical protein